MINDKKVILVVLSRVLDYPNEQWFNERSEILDFVKKNISSEEIRNEIITRVDLLFRMTLKDLQELYVATFDQGERTNLYLTAHELGDSRKRGMALIQLKELIYKGGYAYNGKELADYIPMLLELLAVGPDEESYFVLSKRIACAILRILKNLPENNPYRNVIDLLMMYVLEAPKLEEISKLENLRENADLDELPYPLMYR